MIIIVVTCMSVTIDGVSTGDSIYYYLELQAITAPPLITIYKSLQYPLSFFQPAVSSPDVPWQWLLTVEILQLPALRSYLHSLPYRTQLATDN
jgi:hypothetical protein